MNVLLVYAHPEPRSFNGAMRNTAVETLEQAGHRVTVSDLYGSGFRADGGPWDFTDLQDPSFFRYQREQVWASEKGGFAPEVAREVERLRAAELIILQFPLWWFSLPAILKGWVERVFVMGFAYRIGHVYEEGPLRGKQGMLALTTGSPNATYGQGGRNPGMDRLLFPIHYGILHYVGMDVLPPFVSYGVNRAGDEERAAELERYREHLGGLASARPLRFEAPSRSLRE
jgi:NAD(P)H dehydrogenase (quinone)